MLGSRFFAPALVMAAAVVCLSGVSVSAQYEWVMPRESPSASVTQTVGVTEISIKYHRPAVKERELWGKFIEYGKAWRAGANEATVVSFSTDVKIEGQPLPAGSYALFMVPTPTEWTIIFNKNAKQWGAFSYKEADDALKVKVQAQPAEHMEYLLFDFPAVSDNTAKVEMRWEKVKVGFTVSVDAPATALAKAKTTFSWQSGWFAANYFLKAKADPNEALKWINASIALDENAGNLILKAKILAELKRYDEAVELGEKGLKLQREKSPNAPTDKTEKLIAEWKSLKGK